MPHVDGCRDENGRLIAFTFPGAYPMIYFTRNGETLCPDCANRESTDKDGDPVTSGDVLWEGHPVECAECGKSVESAYGPAPTT